MPPAENTGRMSRTLQILLEVDEADAADQRLRKYEARRADLDLPLIDVIARAESLEIRFLDMPFALDLGDQPEPVVIALVGWLRRLEHVFGPLIEAFSKDEMSFDPTRNAFAAGPGIFKPAGDRVLATRIASRLGVEEPAALVARAASFVDLAALLAAARPELAAGLQGQVGPEELVRALRDMALNAESGPAQRLEFARAAWRLQPGNRGLASLVVKAALQAGHPEEGREAAAALAGQSRRRARESVLLGRLAQSTGDPDTARRYAEEATSTEPLLSAGWTLKAALARDASDLEVLVDCLERLAVLGSRKALEQLARLPGGQVALRRAIPAFPGDLDPKLWRWRLGVLAVEERLAEFLQLFFAHLEWLEGLDREDLLQVVEIAHRLTESGAGDRLGVLRRRLSDQTLGGDASLAVVEAHALSCLLGGLDEELVGLWTAYPGGFPREWLYRGLLAKARYGALLEQTTSRTAPSDTYYRLRALAGLTMGEAGVQPDRDEVIGLVECLRVDPELTALLRRELARLVQIAPGADGVRQIASLLSDNLVGERS